MRCADSDGKIDQFISPAGVNAAPVLPLHELPGPGSEPYLLAMFLTGAYQEVLRLPSVLLCMIPSMRGVSPGWSACSADCASVTCCMPSVRQTCCAPRQPSRLHTLLQVLGSAHNMFGTTHVVTLQSTPGTSQCG